MKQEKVGYGHGSGLNIYIVYKLQKRTVISPDFTIQNTLFGAIKITKYVNTSHCTYNGYGICFDGNGSFDFGNNTDAKNVIMFGADMSFSSHSTNRANNIYVLGRDLIQGISTTGHSTINAEKLYKANFTEQDKKFVLSLHCNGDHSYLFVSSVQQLFKTKNSEIKIIPLTLGNISQECSVTNAIKLDCMEMFMILL